MQRTLDSLMSVTLYGAESDRFAHLDIHFTDTDDSKFYLVYSTVQYTVCSHQDSGFEEEVMSVWGNTHILVHLLKKM